MKELAEEHGADRLLIVLGINQPATVRIIARTFKEGDPGFAGPLAGIGLNLKSYHILELKEDVPQEIWQREMAIHELEITDQERDSLVQIMESIRSG